jgi:hypothetical protein
MEVRGRSKSGLRKGALTEFRIPHLSPLPLPKGEAGSLSELDPCYRPAAIPRETSTGSTITPRPFCGERIEVRGIRKLFSE